MERSGKHSGCLCINCFWQHFVWCVLKNSGIPGGRTTKLPRHFIRDPGAWKHTLWNTPKGETWNEMRWDDKPCAMSMSIHPCSKCSTRRFLAWPHAIQRLKSKTGAGTSLDVSSDILRTLQRALLSGALQACSTPLLVAKQRNSKYCLTKWVLNE